MSNESTNKDFGRMAQATAESIERAQAAESTEAKFDDRRVDPRLIPEKWLADVKWFDHIQGYSDVCTWQCGVCFQTWDSSAKLPCPRCRPNWKDELASLGQGVEAQPCTLGCETQEEHEERTSSAQAGDYERGRADMQRECLEIVRNAGTEWGDAAHARKSKTYSAYVIAALDLEGRIAEWPPGHSS